MQPQIVGDSQVPWPNLANNGAFQPPAENRPKDRHESVGELDSINDVRESAFHRKPRRCPK
jgi:hypothetical protein